jgi:hypothetical protein
MGGRRSPPRPGNWFIACGGCNFRLHRSGGCVLLSFVNSADTIRQFYDDPERLLRRFVIRRAGEMGRVALFLSGLLTLPRRAVDATRARLDGARLDGARLEEARRAEARRAEVLAAAARALAWANALRRRMMRLNRLQKAEALLPGFAPAPAGSLVAVARVAPERDRAPPPPPAGFQPMALDAVRQALRQPFLSPAMMEALVNTVQARAVTLKREIDEDLRRRRAAAAAAAADGRRTPEDDAAELAVEELSFEEAVKRVCDELEMVATELDEPELVVAVRSVGEDLQRRCRAMGEMKERAAARRAAAEAAVAESVTAVVAPMGMDPVGMAPVGVAPVGMAPVADPVLAAHPVAMADPAADPVVVARAATPLCLALRHVAPRCPSLRAALRGSVSVARAPPDTG